MSIHRKADKNKKNPLEDKVVEKIVKKTSVEPAGS
jgi:hypothetical protein